ncbi:MAG: glutamate--tRNA ligase [Syntrophales bacterium]|nr:glutamate--tRNA ligase [Syntrophales bacterium]MDD5233429.1 glutamate--tRNA ligase [Syntrophales bacterium]
MSEQRIVRTRFAPSPTGALHIGGVRTALFNWLYARHAGGKFILRIEDTDQLRSTDESTRGILDSMSWLGLNWDEGPLFQTERAGIYRDAVRKLIDEGKAYRCACPPEELERKRKKALAERRKPKYDGTCRHRNIGPNPNTVVRFRCPDRGTTAFEDLVKGRISFENDELDDLVIERSDGFPTYNFAVVVDDALMGITHVIRGDDHVNNTPRQILLYKALGHDVPAFGHVPMILGSDKARLSKRHGATSVTAYRDMGYLPEALVNYLVRLGWSHGDQEIFSLDDLIRLFTLEAVGKSAAVFNPDKLLWLNQHYIKGAAPDRLARELAPFLEDLGITNPDPDFLARVAADLQTRSKTLVEMAESARFYFNEIRDYDLQLAEKYFDSTGAIYIQSVREALPGLGEYKKEGIENLLRKIAEENGTKLKNVVQPIRVALTGKTVSPGIDEVMVTLGKEGVMRRLDNALEFIRSG